MFSTSLVLHSLIFSSLIRHHRSCVRFFRRRRDVSPPEDLWPLLLILGSRLDVPVGVVVDAGEGGGFADDEAEAEAEAEDEDGAWRDAEEAEAGEMLRGLTSS